MFLPLLLFLRRVEESVWRYLEACPVLIKKLLFRHSHLLDRHRPFQKKFSLKNIVQSINFLTLFNLQHKW